MAASMMRSSLLRKNKVHNILMLLSRRKNQTIASAGEESRDESFYPKIKPKFPEGNWGEMSPKIAWLWDELRQSVANIRTVKGKLDHIAEWKVRTWKYNVIDTAPGLLDYQSGITKTGVLFDSLPSIYNETDVEELIDIVKPIVIETIILEHEINRSNLVNKAIKKEKFTPGSVHNVVDREFSHTFLRSLFLNLQGSLVLKTRQTELCHVDNDVTVSATWYRHDVLRNKPRVKPKNPQYIRQNNAPFYGKHVVDFQFRKSLPLPEFVPQDAELSNSLSYSKELTGYSPKVLGQFQEILERNVTAGFNPGDPCPFNHVSVILPNGHSLQRTGHKFGEDYRQQAETGYILSTGFLSAVAQAFMQGFNYFEELTYPFTTQTILTDGQHFVFSAYQLNTLLLWKDDTASTRQNLCWVKNCGKLYEKCEEGKVVGFNDDALKLLLKFFTIPSSDRNGVDFSPNIDEAEKWVIRDKEIVEVVEEPFEYDRQN